MSYYWQCEVCHQITVLALGTDWIAVLAGAYVPMKYAFETFSR